MPNGSADISTTEWMKIRAFFDKLSGMLLDFATRHNIAVVEYYHESPSWSFRFQHPNGGAAAVHVMRLSESAIRLSGSWYVDEYETFTRHLKSGPNHDFLLDGIDLRKQLEACLAEIVGWERRELIPHSGYGKFWSVYTKEEWDKISNSLNLPRLKP